VATEPRVSFFVLGKGKMGYGRTDGWWREGMAAGVVVSTGSGSFRLMGKKGGVCMLLFYFCALLHFYLFYHYMFTSIHPSVNHPIFTPLPIYFCTSVVYLTTYSFYDDTSLSVSSSFFLPLFYFIL